MYTPRDFLCPGAGQLGESGDLTGLQALQKVEAQLRLAWIAHDVGYDRQGGPVGAALLCRAARPRTTVRGSLYRGRNVRRAGPARREHCGEHRRSRRRVQVRRERDREPSGLAQGNPGSGPRRVATRGTRVVRHRMAPRSRRRRVGCTSWPNGSPTPTTCTAPARASTSSANGSASEPGVSRVYEIRDDDPAIRAQIDALPETARDSWAETVRARAVAPWTVGESWLPRQT